MRSLKRRKFVWNPCLLSLTYKAVLPSMIPWRLVSHIMFCSLVKNLCFRFPNLLLVKCLSLQHYLVIIPTSNSGGVLLLQFLLQIYTPVPTVYPSFGFYTVYLLIRQGLRGDHWVLYNYIKAEKQFQVLPIIFNFVVQSLWSITGYFSQFCFYF